MIKVISIFLKQTHIKINELEKSVLDENYMEITNASHFLKSSFTTMGIDCYKEICEIEDLSKQSNSIEKISTTLKNMTPTYNEAIHEYKLLLDKLRS
jgi:HPt (histidine-containing phosphotransfer) domain-containing protein